eukprot:scaffold7632_cov81-Skeletonema_dohrnii-CCMP3373.AAC.1
MVLVCHWVWLVIECWTRGQARTGKDSVGHGRTGQDGLGQTWTGLARKRNGAVQKHGQQGQPESLLTAITYLGNQLLLVTHYSWP